MPERIIPADAPPDAAGAGRLAEVLEDFDRKMTLGHADRVLGVGSGTVARAVRRGELGFVQLGTARKYVTPRLLAEWVERSTHMAGEAVA